MTFRTARARAAHTLQVLAVVIPSVLAGPALGQPSGYAITDDDSYARFQDAVRAAEYVREDYITGSVPIVDGSGAVIGEASTPGTRPIVIAAVASAVAFMERNPDADAAAFAIFIEAIDAELALAYPGDPGLVVPQNFLAALRHTRFVTRPAFSVVPGQPIMDLPPFLLAGYDTDVGERALELLGAVVPDPINRATLGDRVETYERLITRNIATRRELGQLLTHAFMNQTPDGQTHAADYAPALDAYLRDQGYDPALGSVRPELVGVNDALAQLPATFAEYQAELAEPVQRMFRLPGESDEDFRARLAASPIQQRMREAIYETIDATGEILSSIGDEVTFEQAQALSDEQLDAIAAQRLADLRSASRARASLIANAMLLYDNVPAADYVVQQADLGSAALGANTTWSNIKSGLSIGLSAISFGAAIYSGDAADAAGAFSAVADGVLTLFGVAETNLSEGVTTDDIYEQIQEMQQQLVDMQNQLNERFDRIDRKLDVLFNTMITQWEAIDGRLTDIEETVDAAVALVLEQAAALRRLEDTILAVGRDQLNQLFDQGVNLYLDARGVSDLPLSGPFSFESGASEFYTFATSTAGAVAFIGNPASPFPLSQTDELLGDGVVSPRLAELHAHALSLFPELATDLPDDVVSPEAWSLAASAYARLAEESPWYFARVFTQDNSDGHTDLDDIIAAGQQLTQFADALRLHGSHGLQSPDFQPLTEPTAFYHLYQRHRAASSALQNGLYDRLSVHLADTNLFGTPLASPAKQLAIWQTNSTQDVTSLAPPITQIIAHWGTSSDTLTLGSFAHEEGYMTFFPSHSPGILDADRDDARRAKLHTLRLAEQSGGTFRAPHWYNTAASQSTDYWFVIELPTSATNPEGGTYDHLRRIRYTRQRLVTGSGWVNDRPSSSSDAAATIKATWNGFFRDRISDGNRIGDVVSNTFVLNSEFHRLIIREDNRFGPPSEDALEDEIKRWLTDVRGRVRAQLILELLEPATTLNTLAAALDDEESLIDAYVSIAMPGLLARSGVVRSALRGAAPNASDDFEGSEIGIRSEDAVQLMLRFDDADEADDLDWGDQSNDFASLDFWFLFQRILTVRREIAAADTLPDQSAPYPAWTLEQLKHLRTHAARLAIDDTYAVHTDAQTRSVLDNDVHQLRFIDQDINGNFIGVFRPLTVDLNFGPGDELDGYWAPTNGQVEMNADGAFTYTPDPGFKGFDRFSYRAICDISPNLDGTTLAFSDPAFVRVYVGINQQGCNAADLAEPFGVFDFSDVFEFLVAFGSMNASVDYAEPFGVFDFSDVFEFLVEFGAGCP